MEKIENEFKDSLSIKSLLIVFSYHHQNTEKIAKAIAKVLDAQIYKSPQQLNLKELQKYSLIGFGSGIYSGKHNKFLLEFVDQLPQVTNKNAFIFSTYGAPALAITNELIIKNHSILREKLQSKGYLIIDEFSCPGFNTNSFLKIFGGINKGRPNAEDYKHAEEFARNLKQKTSSS